MTWPIVDLAFWEIADVRTNALDALVSDPLTPLGRLGLSAVASTYAETTGAPLAEQHRRLADLVSAKSLAVDGALTEVVPALEREGIPFFVAKGPSMLGQYADPRLRAYTDLDVYVAVDTLESARAALGRCGYVAVRQRTGPLGGQPRELHGGSFGAVVEVHGDVIDNLQRRWLPPVADYLPFVEHRAIHGLYVPTLSDAAHLCLQAIHLGAGHRYARLSCYRDIDRLSHALDVHIVDVLGARPYLSTTLAVLHNWGRDVPVLASTGRAHTRLVESLQIDPTCWDEFAPTVRNVLALANQSTVRAGVTATLAAARALLPERGRRASASRTKVASRLRP